ncbi:hypothetical protein BC938DRAFT_477845, partial [Jimgerdemannia flammicorona]
PFNSHRSRIATHPLPNLSGKWARPCRRGNPPRHLYCHIRLLHDMGSYHALRGRGPPATRPLPPARVRDPYSRRFAPIRPDCHLLVSGACDDQNQEEGEEGELA